MKDLDGVFITHTHFDHFDDEAIRLLPKDLEIFCAPHDVKKIRKAGFTKITAIDGSAILYGDIQVKTAGGKHGTGVAGKLMGKNTGYVLKDMAQQKEEPSLYIVGDSIWCEDVAQTITREKPEVITLFAGAARLPFGKAITMDTGDIEQLALAQPKAKVVATHMDTWSHCFLTRDKLKSFLKDKIYKNRVLIPNDGDSFVIN